MFVPSSWTSRSSTRRHSIAVCWMDESWEIFSYPLDWSSRWIRLSHEMASLEIIICLGCCRGRIPESDRPGNGEERGTALKDSKCPFSVAKMQRERHSKRNQTLVPILPLAMGHLSLNLPGLRLLHMRNDYDEWSTDANSLNEEKQHSLRGKPWPY